MKYILSENIDLCSWPDVPFSYWDRQRKVFHALSKEEFDLLSLCDGFHEIDGTPASLSVFSKGLIHSIHDEHATIQSAIKRYDNHYMPSMNLELTAKCNYNCIHCFNASDNAPLHSEFTYEEVISLLNEAEACGVKGVTITGGEPFVHKQFLDIIREIYKRGMYVSEINTNGSFLKKEILDELIKIGCNPLLKISFDGLGYHDWMRNRKGAESDALRAIRLCIDNGFRVFVQYNINKRNLSTVSETINLLDKMGVSIIRIIRTTPAPRWEQNAVGQTLNYKEYYDISIEIFQDYIQSEHSAQIIIWQIGSLNPIQKHFSLTPVKSISLKQFEAYPLCMDNRCMIAIGANGQVYPCMQMSGWFDEHYIDLGNVKRDGLKSILQNSKYMSSICQTVHDRCKHNEKCGNCKYLRYCLGGCPALAILGSETGDILAPDPTKCFFYENGYYHKFVSALSGYKNLTEIDL